MHSCMTSLCRLLLTLGSAAAFVNVVPTTTTGTIPSSPSLTRAVDVHHDIALGSWSPSPVATKTLVEERLVSSTLERTYNAYTDAQRPVFSFTDTSNVLTPVFERIRNAAEDAKAAVSEIAHKASKMGVSFGLSYSLLSNLNGAITLSVAWFLTANKTGLSPVHQWKTLLKTYGSMYAFLQALKPLRIAAAVSLARTTERWLDMVQDRFACGRSKAVAVQYALGYVVQAIVASAGIWVASSTSGVPVFGAP